MTNRLKEFLDTPVTPRDLIREAGTVARETVIGALKGLDAISRRQDGDNRDFGKRAAEATLIPLTSLFGESRRALGRLFSKSDAPKQ